MRRGTGLALAGAALLAAASTATARAADRHAIVAVLNAERAANGIPALVRENPAWSAKCAAHVEYMAASRSLTHVEDPGTPGYTSSGSWAAQNSVLAQGASWDRGDPFADAPLHLIQLMSPELRRVGVAEGSGFLCVTTWPGYDPAGWRKPTVYTYPGDGATGVPYAETADELPFVPGDFVGLPRGTTTGFNMMVYAEGIADPWHSHIVSATLAGPTGRVGVKTVDRTTPTVGAYLPPGSGFVIPVDPLRPGVTYRATVGFAGGVRYSWSFTAARR